MSGFPQYRINKSCLNSKRDFKKKSRGVITYSAITLLSWIIY